MRCLLLQAVYAEMFLRKFGWSPPAARLMKVKTLTTSRTIVPCDITTTTRTIVPYDRRERLISIYKTILRNIESVPRAAEGEQCSANLEKFTLWREALEQLTRFRLSTCEKYPDWDLIEKIGSGPFSPNGLIEEAKLENDQLCKSIEYYYGTSQKNSSDNQTSDKSED